MDIRAFPDTTGYAPKAQRWHAIDMDTYDGADDAPSCLSGYGYTASEAILDLIDILLDEGEITHDERRELLALHNINPRLWREGAR